MGDAGDDELSRLRSSEVDGVPVVWAQDDRPGPLRAGMALRVGVCDEPFHRRGITHVLEHLALFGLGRPGDHSNGSVDATTTRFDVAGEPDEVVEFLGRLTRQLGSPPTHRLADELGVIAAEAAGRRPGVVDHLRGWRYGATGLGGTGEDEVGVRALGADDLAAWAARFAVRQNAVLWLSGPPPAGLRLHLADGAWAQPPSAAADLGRPGRGFVVGPGGAVGSHSVVTRSVRATAFVSVLTERLVDVLRTEDAVSYSPQAAYLRTDAGTAELVTVADVVPGRQTDAAQSMLRVLEGLAGERPGLGVSTDEVARAVARARRDAAAAGPLVDVLGAAFDVLLHARTTRAAQALDELALLSPRDVEEVAREVVGTAVLQVPGAVRLPSTWSRWVDEQEPVTGVTHRHLEHPDETTTLVVGPDGLSAGTPGGRSATVRYRDVVGMLRWDDGGVVVKGRDGVGLTVEPTMWERGRAAVEAVGAAVDPALVVPLGSRPPSAVPAPVPEQVRRAQRRAAAPEGGVRGAWRTVRSRWPEALSVPVVAVPVWALQLAGGGTPNVLALVGSLLLGPMVVGGVRRHRARGDGEV